MTCSIRDAVFESNSSSSHSLVIANGDVFELSFPAADTRRGKVILSAQEEGYTRWFRFYRPENILAYLIIAEIESHPIPKVDALRKEIVDMVSDVRPADVLPIIRWNFPVIDSAISYLEGDYGLEFEFLLPDHHATFNLRTGNLHAITGYLNKKERLKALLFHRDSYLETNPENDFGVRPRFIPTDLQDNDVISDHDLQLKRSIKEIEDTITMLEEMVKEQFIDE